MVVSALHWPKLQLCLWSEVKSLVNNNKFAVNWVSCWFIQEQRNWELIFHSTPTWNLVTHMSYHVTFSCIDINNKYNTRQPYCWQYRFKSSTLLFKTDIFIVDLVFILFWGCYGSGYLEFPWTTLDALNWVRICFIFVMCRPVWDTVVKGSDMIRTKERDWTIITRNTD